MNLMPPSDHRQSNKKIIAVSDAVALAKAAADRMMAAIASGRDRMAICLTGGSSPRRLYRLLATDPYRSQMPWDRVHWFIGDERFVAAESPLNNLAMARQAFLDGNAPTANIHPIPCIDDPERSAGLYERELKSFYGTDVLDPARPLFDIVLMGLGPDGHTASLFPDQPTLNETTRWVIGVPKAHAAPFVPRVTLTFPVLNSSREMLFEVSGADKRPILTRVLAGEDLPANRAHASGETVWLADRDALPENFRAR
jgi:6-phosphogluconolactonase